MSRISPLAPEDVPELEEVFEIKRRSLGFVPNSALTMARWPELAQAYGMLTSAIASATRLPKGLSSLVFLVASNAAGCMYCVAHAGSKASSSGVFDSKIEAVWEFQTSSLFTAAEKAALNLALAAGGSPPMVTEEHFDELQRHYDDQAIVEIAGVIAFSGFMNRWNAIMGTELEHTPRAVAERLLAEGGWHVGPHGGEKSTE